MNKKTCCFTGHRILNQALKAFIKQIVTDEATKLINQGVRYFIAGGALGFDTLAAQTVLDLKKDYAQIKLILAILCKNQSDKWSYENKVEYEKIKNASDKVIYLSEKYESSCMLKRNKYMVDKSDFVIAAWDGRKRGGTYYTVNYAKKLGKKIIFIDTGSKNDDID